VLGFVMGNRTDAMLALCWSDVPQDWSRPVCAPVVGTLTAEFFPSWQRKPVTRRRRQDSHGEGWNTIIDAQARQKCRRQSGEDCAAPAAYTSGIEPT